jgi:hypothetical protein
VSSRRQQRDWLIAGAAVAIALGIAAWMVFLS